MKYKTLAAWLALIAGPMGMHRFYLYGLSDAIGLALPWPTLLGLYGVWRARHFGLDDLQSWWLIPLLGLSVSLCALQAIVIGLTSAERWNLRHNPGTPPDHAAGQTRRLTVAALVISLLLGTTVLMATLAFTFQRYFEFQSLSAT